MSRSKPTKTPTGEAAVERDPRWVAVLARDKRSDGRFFYSVKTTGVYCRPSCGSRAARPENVAFHPTRAEAERAGFRPCKRCRPDQPPLEEQHAALIAELCRLLEESEVPPTLEALAAHAGFSVFHTHRLFKAVTGSTPKAYASAHRAERVRKELPKSSTVTEALHRAGYSSGRFYEASTALLGMTPTDYRTGGQGLEIRFAIDVCTLGAILVAATDRGVCAIFLGGEPDPLIDDLRRRFPKAKIEGPSPGLEALVTKVIGLVEEPRLGIKLPLDVRGTAFQQRVWKALLEIPAGATKSYSEIAAAIGAPKSVRAVARACASNPIALAVPCHRVVGANGDLSGYRWGLSRKRALLDREGRR